MKYHEVYHLFTMYTRNKKKDLKDRPFGKT